MRALDAVITAIDFESTGSVPGYPAEPWQIGMVRLERGRVEPTDTFERLLRVGRRPFSPYAPGRHAQLREQLAAAPKPVELWPELAPWLSGPLAAHNAATEQGFLKTLAPLHRFGPWLDTLKLSRIAYPDLPSHALEDLIPGLELEEETRLACPGREPHDALYDAAACAVLLRHLLHLPGWESFSLAYLSRLHPQRYYRRKI